jgi:exosortase
MGKSALGFNMVNKTQLTHSTTELILPQLLLVLLVLLYFPSFVDLSSEWTQWDQSLSHAYPLLLAFVFLLYKASPLLVRKQHWSLDWMLVCALFMASLLWFLFYSIQIKILEQLILLLILLLILAYVFSIKTFWELRFLLIMPLFVLPIWDYLNEFLVQLSSSVVGEMVRAIKIPALIDGNSIFIPSGHIMIADGCSGLRYFIISLALGYAISYLNGYKEKGLILSLSIAALLGLIANWLRIFILILIGYYTEMESSLMRDHEVFGWVLFAVLCFPAIYFAPVVKVAVVTKKVADTKVSIRKLVCLIIALIPGSLMGQFFNSENDYLIKDYSIDPSVWNQVVAAPSRLLLPHSQKQFRLSNRDNVYLQLDQYKPDAGRRLVPYIPRQYDLEWWVLDSTKVLKRENHNVRVDILRQKSGLKKIIQVQWFDVGGWYAAEVSIAKLMQIPAVVSGKKYFTIFTLQLECTENTCTEGLQKVLIASDSVNK